MIRNLRPTLAAAALTATLLLPASAGAATNQYRAQGETVVASFATVDATGCIWTYIEVYAYANRVRVDSGPSDPATGLDLYINGFDQCQGGSPVYDLYTGALVPSSALDVNGGLQSASLQATVDAFNWVTGTYEPVAIDLTWTGEGEALRGHTTSSATFPGGRYTTRLNGSYRLASVAGSVTLQSTNLLTNVRFSSGMIASSVSSYTTVHHTR